MASNGQKSSNRAQIARNHEGARRYGNAQGVESRSVCGRFVMAYQGDVREEERPHQCIERVSWEPDCPECARLKSKLEWCRKELYGWAEFCTFRDLGPFGRGVDDSNEVVDYFGLIDLNIGDI